MVEYLDVLTYISNALFFTSTATNLFFIYLTVVHIRQITGTYKRMIITFALLGILFSGWELIAHPFFHNYNKAFMLFSLNSWMDVPQRYLQVILAIYAGLYTSLISFITVQFVFRYLTLAMPHCAKKFDGIGWIGWICYTAVCGIGFVLTLDVFLQPDEYSDSYLRNEIQSIYSLEITEVARYQVIPYAADGSLRFNNLFFLVSASSIIAIQYTIILICGIEMRQHIKKELHNLSCLHRKLERQFFRALVVQILLPTLIFFVPAFPLLLLPMLDIKISLQSGAAFAVYSLYPPLDSVCFILIVTEYRTILKKWYQKCLKQAVVPVTNAPRTSVSTTNVTKM